MSRSRPRKRCAEYIDACVLSEKPLRTHIRHSTCTASACVRSGCSTRHLLPAAYVSIRQHTSAYVSIRQHLLAQPAPVCAADALHPTC
jgi:hypothetical protein